MIYHLRELPTRIAERAKSTFTLEEFLKIKDDKFLRAIVADAAGREAAALLQSIRNTHKNHADLLGERVFQDTTNDIFNRIFGKDRKDSAITQAVAILKAEQKSLLQQANARRI